MSTALSTRTHSQRRRAPRAVYADATQRAIAGAARLASADVSAQLAIVSRAIDGLLAGHDAQRHWLDLADTANVAETLAHMGLGGGDQALQAIADAQEALAYCHQEHTSRRTWALRADERAEIRVRLEWLQAVHATQLGLCSYGEFCRAMDNTATRIAQARAGNAPSGALVIEGAIA